MLAIISSVRSLLVAIMLLMVGAGFLTSLVSVRLQSSGIDPVVIGLVATSYFAGLTAGAVRCGRLVQRVGHIRAFAVFVSILSTSTLSYTLGDTPLLWVLLRFIDGICIAGVYICLESWLNDRADGESRGSVLAFYMIALYGGQALGQLLLNIGDAEPAKAFLIASIFISFAIVPVALTQLPGPALEQSERLSLRMLHDASPLGVVGVATTGMMLGAFYGLGPVYARAEGLSVSGTALFMTVTIAGGVLLQWPLGLLSDRFDRRRVIIGTIGGAAAACFGLIYTGPAGWGMFFAALFGGTSFALYPLCVAHANDHLSAAQRIGATGGLVQIYSLGAVAGPLMASAVVSFSGPSGLFATNGGIAILILLFSIWRLRQAPPVPSQEQNAYQILPRTTAVASLLDPHSPSDDEDVAPTTH